MNLREKQSLFLKMLAELIIWATDQGYQFTVGDAYRDPRLHGKLGEKKGYGHRNSCHKLRLAADLNLFMDYDHDGDDDYMEDTEAHRPIGEKWESMGGSWGGRFDDGDGNHYSLEHNGIR